MNRTIPLVLAVALFMEQMDSTVIATALPAIANAIGTTPVALKLALTSYLVSLAIFIPVSGWMADRFGAKLVFRTAIGVFVLGSICCAVSGSLGAFVASRFFQGMGGAMMTPVGRLVLVRSTQKSDLVNAMAWLSIPALIGPMMGPPVGGFITTFFSWRWIFLINVPIGLIGIWLSGLVLPEIPLRAVRRLDTAGFALSAVAASGIVFGLSVVSLPALPPAVGVATLVVGLVSVAIYVRHALSVADPILNPGLFANPVFRAAIVGGSIFRIGAGAVPFLMPLMLEIAFGLSPFRSGLITFASAFGALAMKFLAPRILRVGGFRNILIFGVVSGAAFIAVNGLFTAATAHAMIVGALIAGGFLRSLFFTSTNALVFAEIADEEMSQATAIAAVSQQISIALGVAIAGGLLEATASLSGAGLTTGTFSVAFILVAAMAACAVFPYLGLSPQAGSAVSGHKMRVERARAPARIAHSK